MKQARYDVISYAEVGQLLGCVLPCMFSTRVGRWCMILVLSESSYKAVLKLESGLGFYIVSCDEYEMTVLKPSSRIMLDMKFRSLILPFS